MKHSGAIGIALALVLAVAGCSPNTEFPKAKVTGKVTYKGNPVPQASLAFLSADGHATAGSTDDQGVYNIDVAVGVNTVGISKIEGSASSAPPAAGPMGAGGDMSPEAMMKATQTKADATKDQTVGSMDPSEGIEGDEKSTAVAVIPPKYSSPTSSGLSVEVKASPAENKHDFDLTD